MKTSSPLVAAAAGFVMLLGGCAQDPLTGNAYNRSEARTAESIQYGTVEALHPIEITGDNTGGGGLAGGAIGGVLGNSVGSGYGKDIATVLGAVGGAVAGQHIEKAAGRKQGVQITVRLDSGQTYGYVQEVDPKDMFHIGDRVKVVGIGQTSRVQHL